MKRKKPVKHYYGEISRNEILTECPNCGSTKHIEEHGTEPGDFHWWLCRKCSAVINANRYNVVE